MKNKKSFLSLLALTLLSLILLAGCGEKKWPMQITVVNRTTYPISDIRISLASDVDWGDNRIETTLDESGEEIKCRPRCRKIFISEHFFIRVGLSTNEKVYT